ncbi:hypothetical protein PYV61_05335, partial [Roseisolibacter sp. H3M3-2]
APSPASCAALALADGAEAARELRSLVDRVDVADSELLYQSQQQGMALAEAVARCGTRAERDAVLRAAAALVAALPTAGQMAEKSAVTRWGAGLELLSPSLTRLRQRLGALPFSVDGLPVPGGEPRGRRIFPTLAGERVVVMSEVEMQYAYLLSTVVRLEAADAAAASPAAVRDLAALYGFLLRDKVRFYWDEAPAWHWSGPFPDMRTRVRAKLAGRDARVTEPAWFGAIIDHELHLFGVAADLEAARRASPALAGITPVADVAMLHEIRATALDVLRRRVAGGPSGDGFLLDFGRWTSNPSYAYAGCTVSRPLPAAPCPVDSVATDVSHALRWPWWLRSQVASWPAGSAPAAEVEAYRGRLARQLAVRVLYLDSAGRPLTRTYMDGRDGWYRLREFPDHPWGNGPSTLTGSMRYGSWALLSPLDARIARAHRAFCAVLVSDDPTDVTFRTRYYGSPSDRPELGGLGETDLYGPGSLYALTCRIGRAFGLH